MLSPEELHSQEDTGRDVRGVIFCQTLSHLAALVLWLKNINHLKIPSSVSSLSSSCSFSLWGPAARWVFSILPNDSCFSAHDHPVLGICKSTNKDLIHTGPLLAESSGL